MATTVFEVYADDLLIHHSQSPNPEVKLLDPKLTLEVNAAGSFKFKVPPSNVGYGYADQAETRLKIERLTTIITIKRNGSEIWSGRIISEEQDFWGNRSLTCEGELAFLNDTSQPPAEYHDMTVTGFLQALLDIHNAKVGNDKKFYVGTVTVTDPNDSLYRYTNFESTYEAIKEKMLDRLGGYLICYKHPVTGNRTLDYLAEPLNTNPQTIEFGKNLLDFSKSWDLSQFATVVIPQGERLEEHPVDPYTGEDIEALDAYLDVSSVNGGSIYVYNQATVNTYGWIEVRVTWSDVTLPSNLLAKAYEYLSNLQFDKMILELSAIDMSYMTGSSETQINLFDRIHCISKPHGMDRFFPVTKITIPLDNPSDTEFTLGDKEVRTSLSASLRDESEQIKKTIDAMPSTTSVMDEAISESFRNAEEFFSKATTGYVKLITTEDQQTGIHSEKLIASDTLDWTQSTHHWEYGILGLAHYKKNPTTGVDELNGVAIDMLGRINANMITVGALNAGIITTGKIQDIYGYNYWDLDTGAFKLVSNMTKIEDWNQSVQYSYPGIPTAYNYPAVNWITKKERASHASDVYHDTNTDGKYYYWKPTGVTGYKIFFDNRSYLEANYDNLYIIYIKQNGKYGYVRCTGTTFGDDFIVTIPANASIDYMDNASFWLYFTSDQGVATWGFEILKAEAYDGSTFTTETGEWDSFPDYNVSSMQYYATIERAAIHNYDPNIKWKIAIKEAPDPDRWVIKNDGLKDWINYRASVETNEEVFQLDEQLQQDGIFNRLTNNGEARGIFMEPVDNKMELFINADYIATGILKSNDNASDPNFYLNLSTGQLNAKTLNITTPSLIFSSTDNKITSFVDYTESSTVYTRNTEITAGEITSNKKIKSSGSVVRNVKMTDGYISFRDNGVLCGSMYGHYYDSSNYKIQIHADRHLRFESNYDIELSSGLGNIKLSPYNKMYINDNACVENATAWIRMSNGNTGYLQILNGLIVGFSDGS